MTPELATKIAQRLLDEWNIGSYSRFCDDAPDYESGSCEEIAAVICEVALMESNDQPGGINMSGCCRGLPAAVCIARPHGCSDDPDPIEAVWNGAPPNAEQPGWHWLRPRAGGPACPWHWTDENGVPGEFEWATDGDYDVADMARQCCYVGACEMPVRNNPPDLTPELLTCLEGFITETVDYMTINNLGNPEQQHNVKWARRIIAKVTNPNAATGCALNAFKTKETLHTIEFIGDGNAIFRFTGGTEHLIPAGDAAAHLGALLGRHHG